MSKNKVTVNLGAEHMIWLNTMPRTFNFSKYIRQLLDNAIKSGDAIKNDTTD